MGRLHRYPGRQVIGDGDAVIAPAFEPIGHDQPVMGLIDHDAAYRTNRIGQAKIAGMGADQHVLLPPHLPPADFRFRVVMQGPQVVGPDKAVLFFAIDHGGVVGRRTAEPVSPLGRSRIEVGAAIGKQGFAVQHGF